MLRHTRTNLWMPAVLALALAAPAAVHAEPGESQRLERAKDFIADEQWAAGDAGAEGGGGRPEGTQQG